MAKASGYVTDVAYPAHFHKELLPLWLVTLATVKGLRSPSLNQPYSYCELGCGLGINLLVAAACNPLGEFVGVDFNPQHIAFARQASERLGLANLRFVQADFAEFAATNALQFDFVVSHGVWSWIAQAAQQQILSVLKHSLKPQGLFYLHYMCHPGASAMQPVQKLLSELAEHLSASSAQNMGAGLDLLSRLDQAGVFHDQPGMSERLAQLQSMDKAYLAHDLLSPYWQPQHSIDVHRQLAQAGLSYVDSANAFDVLETLSVPQAAQALIANLPSPALRELAKDLARNQRQRQDLFQKCPQALGPQAQLASLAQLRWQLLPGAPRSGGQVFATPIGPIDGPAQLLSPLLERLAQGPASTAELGQLAAYGGNLTVLLQSLLLLMWRGHVHPQRMDAEPQPHVAALTDWLGQHELKIQLAAECGTAVLDEAALAKH
ncbi:class I SAM-dependent methyltransferase [Pseudomonas sp. 5P_3.1_Bac2]|uniref:class I SAM-dependent methyltransferase n=1 Tax=Pseudomonas sp. 5P_3.1_Bac2 TaxID=2971617 RepID=UPI0021C6D1F2|nr:class I SAM-dependent methyltransferase [Pseudomonas sp. 5P_3.1_Bac2]MCU1716739.1 class I SAM-dependent methyltransferase [Pseudomonas sp. 5P_3.1_Bac2]